MRRTIHPGHRQIQQRKKRIAGRRLDVVKEQGRKSRASPMSITFTALPTAPVRALQAGGTDAFGAAPERAISSGDGVPCRHCLKIVEKGKPYLIVAYRPFNSLHPYTETGSIFKCAEECERAQDTAEIPATMYSPTYIVRGYGEDERILYGSGGVVPTNDVPARAAKLLEEEQVAFVHVRSSSNNCFTCRVDRA